MAGDPTGRISHLPLFHRGVAWKEPCRVATTSNVAIATALNAGDTIDGIVLVAGDRVLVKSQSTASQNGIYVAGATPARAFDMDQDSSSDVPAEEVLGAFVFVLDGATLGQTLWYCDLTESPVLGADDITFAQFSGGSGSVAAADILALGFPTQILLADGHGVPFTFDDLLQRDDGEGFLYADV